MRTIYFGLPALVLATVTTPAFAQDKSISDSLSVSGGAAVVSDYRFRGLSQTGEEAAVQGWATMTHDSGFYVGFWGSSTNFNTVDSLGAVKTQSAEIDAIAGYSHKLTSGITVDGGFTYYMYPGGTDLATDYIEPYLAVTGDIGPLTAKVGAAYIPSGQNATGGKDNIYLYTDLSAIIPNTPVKLKGHWGYNDGYIGAGNNYADYSVGAEASWKALTFGVAYVNTSGYGSKAVREAVGADGTVVFSVSASF